MAKKIEAENNPTMDENINAPDSGMYVSLTDPAFDMVELFVDRDPSDENPDILIGINGKNWVMPRGEASVVPRYVADEYKRSVAAQYKADKTAKEMRGIKASNANN